MNRRQFLAGACCTGLLGPVRTLPLRNPEIDMTAETHAHSPVPPPGRPNQASIAVTLFVCGDLMTGRGIDQVLPHPSRPRLFESYIRSALGYVALAEQISGPIRRPVGFDYIWGDALAELHRLQPDARIVNLETAVTVSDDAWPGKGIHYRMQPANVPCVTAAKIDCCVLANNHVLDWGRAGLLETLDVLHRARIRTAGAGRDETAAVAPAIIDMPDKGRVLVLAFGVADSGVPRDWAAGARTPGVNFLSSLSTAAAAAIGRRVRSIKRETDLVVASLHWGDNWGFAIPAAQREFAHALIEQAQVDLVHGHSSHHVKGVEVHRGKPILYGCGDFLNDYEGIEGQEEYRGDLALMYFPTFDPATGRLLRFSMTPTQIRHFRVNRAPDEGERWLFETLNREGRQFGTWAERAENHTFRLRWNEH